MCAMASSNIYEATFKLSRPKEMESSSAWSDDFKVYFAAWKVSDVEIPDLELVVKWETQKTVFVTVAFTEVAEGHFRSVRPSGKTVVKGYEAIFYFKNMYHPANELKICVVEFEQYLETYHKVSRMTEYVKLIDTIRFETNKTLVGKLSVDMLGLFHRKELADAELIHNESSYTLAVHKCVLSARSVCFHEMILRQPSKCIAKIVIEGISKEGLEKLAIFLYSGTTVVEDLKDAEELYKVAKKYEIDPLRELCSIYLSQFIDTESIKYILEFAVANGDDTLKLYAFRFAKNQVKMYGTELNQINYIVHMGLEEWAEEIANLKSDFPPMTDFMKSVFKSKLATCF